MRTRNWIFTDYNRVDWCGLFEDKKISFVGWEMEHGKKRKREHQQGFFQLPPNKYKEKTATLKYLGLEGGTTIKPMRGSLEQNIVYCSKDGSYNQFGKFQEHGANGLDEVVSAIKDQKLTREQVMVTYPNYYCRYGNKLTDLCNVYREVPSWRDITVVWLWGDTGVGKTKLASGESDFLIHAGDLKWWCGYDGEKRICIDEVTSDTSIAYLLRLLDGYKLRLQVKGGHTYANWTQVYITSNYSPTYLYPDGKHLQALLRRLTEVREIFANSTISMEE